jgi:hypothetical protein
MTFYVIIKLLIVISILFMTVIVECSLADALIASKSIKKLWISPHRNSERIFVATDDRILTLRSNQIQSILKQADSLNPRSVSDLIVINTRDSKSILSKKLFPKKRCFLHQICVSCINGTTSYLRKFWWTLPMILAFIPIYSSIFLKTLPSMPNWWPLTKMDRLFQSPYYGLVATLFLSSNAFYFISGAYLLSRFSPATSSLKGYQILGILLLLSGTVSTIFHYYQALGSFRIAEALCYVDHALAVTSILSFWHRCGRPGKLTTLLGISGLIMLVITDPLHIYPYLHSTWHGLSAGAAILWAHDGAKRREYPEIRLGYNQEGTFT